MAPGTGHGKSKPREIIPVDQPRLYKCACYRKTIKNTQGHMVNQHKTIKKMKRQNKEHMANKRSKLSMELLPPNEADWSKYCTSKLRLDESLRWKQMMIYLEELNQVDVCHCLQALMTRKWGRRTMETWTPTNLTLHWSLDVIISWQEFLPWSPYP